MFIQTEATPNPATLKFLPGQEVLASGTAEFRDAAGAAASPLAQGLFAIEGVTGVYLGRDFITVSKSDNKEWLLLKPAILGAIMDHFVSGRPALLESGAHGHAEGGEESEIVAQIKDLLDTRIRPAVAQDGAKAAEDRLGGGGQHRMTPLRLARVDVREMDLHERNLGGRKRIADGQRRVRIGASVDQCPLRDAAQPLDGRDQLSLPVVLGAENVDAQLRANCAKPGFDICESRCPVQRGFARAEQVEVRAVEDCDSHFFLRPSSQAVNCSMSASRSSPPSPAGDGGAELPGEEPS